MKITRRGLLVSGVAASLAGCAEAGPQFLTYDGPPVTAIVAWKERRRMVLMHNEQILKQYDIQLGFNPIGHKEFEGDGKTPEGTYYIDRKNPRSAYHLSVGISYPNADDRAHARAQGRSPGGDIFIHGTPRRFEKTPDWTVGCLAVTNEEAEEIFAMVNVGTPIVILP